MIAFSPQFIAFYTFKCRSHRLTSQLHLDFFLPYFANTLFQVLRANNIYFLISPQGSPTTELLNALSADPAPTIMSQWLSAKRIKCVENASVLVRLCDARRISELPYLNPFSEELKVSISPLLMFGDAINVISQYFR